VSGLDTRTCRNPSIVGVQKCRQVVVGDGEGRQRTSSSNDFHFYSIKIKNSFSVSIKTLQKYIIVQCRVENVSKTGKMWRNSSIWGEIRLFLGRKMEETAISLDDFLYF
jgi:hypothetical protein